MDATLIEQAQHWTTKPQQLYASLSLSLDIRRHNKYIYIYLTCTSHDDFFNFFYRNIVTYHESFNKLNKRELKSSYFLMEETNTYNIYISLFLTLQ